MRPLKTLFPLIAIAGAIFIGFGDKFLPQPFSSYSRNVREQIDQKLLGLVEGRKTQPGENPNETKPGLIDRVRQNSKPDTLFERVRTIEETEK